MICIVRQHIKLYAIPDFRLDYYVSKSGNVWSEISQKFLLPSPLSCGHLQIRMQKEKKQFIKAVHRLVLETFVGPCPEGMVTCHNNGDPTDNRLENLRWDTRKNNTLDAMRHGTHCCLRKGEENNRAKLNNLQVRVIKRLLNFGRLTQVEIGNIFGVSKQVIWTIKHNINWKHITI